MIRMLGMLGIATLVVGAALAQDETSAPTPVAPQAFTPDFEGPSTAPLPLYPSRALGRGLAGLTHICCAPRPDRTLRCVLGFEWPEDSGFGDATLRYASGLHLTEESFAALTARSNHAFQIAMRYHVEPAPPELDAIAQTIHDRADGLCGAESGPAPDYIVVRARRRGR